MRKHLPLTATLTVAALLGVMIFIRLARGPNQGFDTTCVGHLRRCPTHSSWPACSEGHAEQLLLVATTFDHRAFINREAEWGQSKTGLAPIVDACPDSDLPGTCDITTTIRNPNPGPTPDARRPTPGGHIDIVTGGGGITLEARCRAVRRDALGVPIRIRGQRESGRHLPVSATLCVGRGRLVQWNIVIR